MVLAFEMRLKLKNNTHQTTTYDGGLLQNNTTRERTNCHPTAKIPFLKCLDKKIDVIKNISSAYKGKRYI